jgi:hypothetical protein
VTEYPILIRRLTGDKALTIICERCEAEAVVHPDDILNEGLYECPADEERGRTASTEPRCGGSAVMKYDEGDECKGCDKLGFWDRDTLKGCCSRKCMLQVEYLRTIRSGV